MRVKDGRLLCPNLIILPTDPPKYRNVHLKLKHILETYTQTIVPKSIDEFVLNLEGYPAYHQGMVNIGRQIKDRIKQEVGDWLTVSIGIGSNRFLAKTAASLRKPDGLDEISIHNYQTVYNQLKLEDLTGIAHQNAIRLNNAGIFTVTDMFQAGIPQLKAAFHSVNGYYWYLRLKGWEIDDVDFGRKSFGNSYSLPVNLSTPEELAPIIMKLTQKTSERLRSHGYFAHGVHFSVLFRDGTHWHHGQKSQAALFETQEIYRHLFRIFHHCPYRKPVAVVAVSCFNLQDNKALQLDLFGDTDKKYRLVQAVDTINERYGDYVITPAMMLGTNGYVPDRIAFGGVKELEDYLLH
jgi:DNA polymerase-4